MFSPITENTESLNLANYFKKIKSNVSQLGGVDEFSATSSMSDSIVVNKNKFLKTLLVFALIVSVLYLCFNMQSSKKTHRILLKSSKSKSSESKSESKSKSKSSKSSKSK